MDQQTKTDLKPAATPKKHQARSFTQVVTSYRNRFGVDDDQTTVTEAERKIRRDAAPQIADEFYDFATPAWLVNWSPHFHYTPFPTPSSTLDSSLTHYAHYLSHLLSLSPSDLVLDVGCGVGAPARSIARFAGCKIIGISINQRQIDIAINRTAREGLSHICTFICGNFLELPFPDGVFDAVIGIEATCHAPNLSIVYNEISRVLKPGGRVGISEWVLKPLYDPSNTAHVGIRNRIERGNSIANLHTYAQARTAFLNAGFHLDIDEDYTKHFDYAYHLTSSHPQFAQPGLSPVPIPSPPASHPLFTPTLHSQPTYLAPPPLTLSMPSSLPNPAYRPWYHLLSGKTHLSPTHSDKWTAFKLKKGPVRKIFYTFFTSLEKIGLNPKGVGAAMTTLAYCVDSVEEGGREGIFSPCWWFIGRKISSECRGESVSKDGGNDVGGIAAKVDGGNGNHNIA